MSIALRRAVVPAVATLGAILLISTTMLGGRDAAAGGPPTPVEGGMAPPSQAQPRGLIVRYKRGTTPGAIKQLERELGVQATNAGFFSGLRGLKFEDAADLNDVLARLLASGLVEEAGYDLTVTAFDAPDDPGYTRQWHLHNTDGGLRAEAAWDLAPQRGSGVVVAVIDTGAAFESNTRPGLFGTATFAGAPDLAGIPIVAPWDYIHDDAHPNDDHGHGSHVSGTILQATDNGTGVAGVAGGASLMPIKVLDYSGQGQASDLVDAI